MMTLTENAAYIKGLAEGLDLDATKPEGKLITKMLDLISDMADCLSDLEDECDELRAYIEEIDDDLADVEDEIFEYEYEDEDDEDDEDDDEAFYEVICPNCGETVCFDDTLDPENLTCPACQETFDCTCDGECDCCEGCEE